MSFQSHLFYIELKAFIENSLSSYIEPYNTLQQPIKELLCKYFDTYHVKIIKSELFIKIVGAVNHNSLYIDISIFDEYEFSISNNSSLSEWKWDCFEFDYDLADEMFDYEYTPEYPKMNILDAVSSYFLNYINCDFDLLIVEDCCNYYLLIPSNIFEGFIFSCNSTMMNVYNQCHPNGTYLAINLYALIHIIEYDICKCIDIPQWLKDEFQKCFRFHVHISESSYKFIVKYIEVEDYTTSIFGSDYAEPVDSQNKVMWKFYYKGTLLK